MANVTDPLARNIHGTNPQNLIEYITRQKIYDSQYWKEECFGLNAVDIAAKAAQLRAVGGSYGGNSKPTRFLCLILKMLQIQPDEDIVDELINNEDFKYVRALGAFYLRLTGRPAEIYEKLEPLYNDYRPIRRRDLNGWTLMTVDELVDELLREERVCSIAFPRLPKRDVLVEAGYLEGPRRSAAMELVTDDSPERIEKALAVLAEDGNVAAKKALEQRREARHGNENDVVAGRAVAVVPLEVTNHKVEEGWETSLGGDSDINAELLEHRRKRSRSREHEMNRTDEHRYDGRSPGDYDRQGGSSISGAHGRDHKHTHTKRIKKEGCRERKKYGSLFKSTGEDELKTSRAACKHGNIEETLKDDEAVERGKAVEGSEEYWNEQREKLGLKPLRR